MKPEAVTSASENPPTCDSSLTRFCEVVCVCTRSWSSARSVGNYQQL